MNDYFSEEVTRIKTIVTAVDDYASFSDEELKKKIKEIFDNRKASIANEDPEIQRFYGAMSYKVENSLLDTVFESIRGLGILGKIISDKTITEIMINGYDNIFVEQNGKLTQIPDRFESQEAFRNIITKFVQEMGRSVTESDPIVDSRLSDGSRVNVVLDPIALNGPIVTIRRFPEEGMTIEKLIKFGSLTNEAAEFLKKLVEAKYNVFISGGTGSGKTTFLNALSNYIPSNERVITIEDSAELQIKNIPNLVRLETRNANATGEGEISIRDLIKSSLRMRPDRIVVGEVRGAEALDMLQAMNTGHDGSLSTGHANSARDMLSRLETMVLSGSPGLPLPAIRQQIVSAVDIIVHLGRMRDSSRKTLEISEILKLDEHGEILLNPLFQFKEDPERSTKEKVIGSLQRTDNEMVHPDKFIASGIYDYL
ncbi:CpaF family protein [Pseudobutyrivibrio sp.]|uniref:CpaF family protein n=1 Tax=Pseudobutyrivibrio sp. TaxID=2014367 RepID=UPI001D3DF936|nr:CpaF family protein [Pseudobutyrivibrio sp.]MBE5909895.1 CpaF family protein [Pseudobutyrivibrio sp.]